MKVEINAAPNAGQVAVVLNELKRIKSKFRRQADVIANAHKTARERAERETAGMDPTMRRGYVKDLTEKYQRETIAAARLAANESAPQLGGAKEILDAARPAHGDRRRLLNLSTLGSSRRAAYQQNLATMGPAALAAAASEAVSTGDAVLAAAVIAVVDARPTQDRPFHTAELVRKLPNTLDAFAPAAQFEAAERELADAESLYRNVSRPESTPFGRIERGLRARQAQPATADTGAEGGE